jgi:hypothetical protein
MTSPTIPQLLAAKSQDAIIQFHRQCYGQLNQQWNIRGQMRMIDLAYIREKDLTEENQRAKIANNYGDSTKYQNITVPVVYPQVEAAVTYQTSVFLTGTPIFGVVAPPASMDQAMQMETIIDNASVRGGWVREIQLFLRDGFKYNISALEAPWCREVTSALDSTSAAKPQMDAKEVIWEGPGLERWDMYNTFFDSRVPITEHHKYGEFCGNTKLMSRIRLKSFIQALPTKTNVKEAFESGLGSMAAGFGTGGIESFYVPQLNPDALLNRNPLATTDWLAWANLNTNNNPNAIQYKNMYEVTTLYGRIIPSDFGIRTPSANTPQIWKFIIVNHQVIIYAERQTNAHNYIPVLFGAPLEDGLNYQSKSFAQNVIPIQDVSTAMLNANIASRRRAISDRVLYDPSRITERQINNPNPSAKIPVRPAAYGKNVAEAVYAFPYRDDQAGLIGQEIAQMSQFANSITFQNPARQGQFVKGNKTLHEYDSVMSHANGPSQSTSLLLETQVFTPLKEIIKINILQYQGGVSLFNRNLQQEVVIDPVALRKAVMDFKISDGLTPSDKLISADSLGMALQTLGSSPQLGSGYNLAPLFSYLMKTQGADLKPFEKSPQQVAYEQAASQWSQIAQITAEKGGDMQKLPPQPKPQDYGYDPATQGSAAAAPPTQVATRVNNITNNITNTGE